MTRPLKGVSGEAPGSVTATSSDRLYHQHNRQVPLADRIGYIARMKMYRDFLKLMTPQQDTTILDVGVTDDLDASAANLLEQLYPHRHNITCAGITDGAVIEEVYPGVKHIRIEAGAPLPFSNRQFDIVYSNAVLEHVGSLENQKQFVLEACRVGRRVFIAVPNRLFPVEVHTGLPLLHFLPKSIFRALLKKTRYAPHASEETLNYLWAKELRALYPAERNAMVLYSGVGYGAFRSNIISYCG